MRHDESNFLMEKISFSSSDLVITTKRVMLFIFMLLPCGQATGKYCVQQLESNKHSQKNEQKIEIYTRTRISFLQRTRRCSRIPGKNAGLGCKGYEKHLSQKSWISYCMCFRDKTKKWLDFVSFLCFFYTCLCTG